jgi:aspartyl-tRNA(Asn)/glutamyl-tRNA(Gln) amidotransferase subunit B
MIETKDGVIIGLEVHVQLNKLRSKLFCSCSTQYHDAEPNTHVCPTCLGLPGALPVINKEAVEYGIRVALVLGCVVQDEIVFYRKNYFYPDLPKGFQISQYDYPLALGGRIKIGGREVRINRVHLEEDPGRLVHKGPIDRSRYSLVDYNRSGMPLLEVVTEPDLRSPGEARVFLNKLRGILEYLDVFNGDLEGAMRVDANLSLRGGLRTEVKNISSYKGVEKALSFEVTRQRNLLRMGKEVKQETRHFDEVRGITVSLRTKEEEQDYRYFPEPDLVPLRISDLVERIKVKIPELPDAKRARFVCDYGISDYHAGVLTSDPRMAEFYEEVTSRVDPILSATWIADTLKGELNYRGASISSIEAEHMIDILRLLIEGRITEVNAREIIRTLLDEGGTTMEIVDRKNLLKAHVSEETVLEVVDECKKAVNDYKSGKEEALDFLIGQVMKRTRGRADPTQVRYLLVKDLA